MSAKLVKRAKEGIETMPGNGNPIVARIGILDYGGRASEPKHDGTPHEASEEPGETLPLFHTKE